MTEHDKERIKNDYENGMTMDEMMDKYHMSRGQLMNAIGKAMNW